MKLTVATLGPLLLPLAVVAGAAMLARPSGESAPKFAQEFKPEPGVLRIALPTNPPNLDPVEMSDTTSDAMVERLGNTLVRFDDKLALIPDLCTALPEVSPDGLSYTFRLKTGVKFHNGREMVAEDVRYSLTRLLEPISKRAWIVDAVDGALEAQAAMKGLQRGAPQAKVRGIETPDSHTVRLRLSHPQPLLPLFLAMNNATVVPREEVEKHGQNFSRNFCGTGPFRLAEWRDNDRLVFERFDGYHGGRFPLRKVIFRVMPEEETRFQSYLAGELDLIEAPFGKVGTLRKSNIKDQVLINPMLDIRYHGINMERDPLGGNPEKRPGGTPLSAEEEARRRKVRQAMNYAVDRKYLCEVILEGRAVPAKGVIPPGMEAFDPSFEGYRYDPERAKRLLAEAGYPGGEGLPVLPYHFNSQAPNPMVAQALQEMLRRVGIRTELKQLDWGAYQNFLDEGKATFFRLAWIADYPDPENFLYVLFHSKNKGSEGNNARYQDPENDARLDAARSCVDAAERLRRWRSAEAAIVEDAPWVFLYHNATALVVKPYVKGLVLTAMDAGPEIQQADLTKVRIEGGGD